MIFVFINISYAKYRFITDCQIAFTRSFS